MRTKEFLSKNGVDYTLIDVENEPGARERMLKLGVRFMPVLVRGEEFTASKNLEVVATFVGLRGRGKARPVLSPQELFDKWTMVLRASQRYVRQLPNAQMNELALQVRERPIWQLGNHIFSIGLAYLECVVGGAKNLTELQKGFQARDKLASGDEIARYGDEVIAKIEQWWAHLEDKSCERNIEIDHYGAMSLHQLLERCTWHSAHHARQIIDLLQGLGIEPDGKLTTEDLAGLPLPERTWD